MNEAKKQALEEEMQRQMMAEGDAGGGDGGEDAVDQRFTLGRGGEMIFKVLTPPFLARMCLTLGRIWERSSLLPGFDLAPSPDDLPRSVILQISSKYKAGNSLKKRIAASKKILDMGKGVPVIGTSALSPCARHHPSSSSPEMVDVLTRQMASQANG